jgi:hypothetical protein
MVLVVVLAWWRALVTVLMGPHPECDEVGLEVEVS